MRKDYHRDAEAQRRAIQRRRSLKCPVRMTSPRSPEADLPPTPVSSFKFQPSSFSSYDLPACVVLWAAVMVGATTAAKREATPAMAKETLKSALAYRSL